MENRLKEIAGNLKRDVRELLNESASIVTDLLKQGLCTANGMTKRWNAFTHGLSQAAKSLFEPFSHVPMIAENQQPIVTVKESACEELPVGTRMTLAEAEERIAELNLSMLDSGGLIQDVRAAIDYSLGELLHEHFGPQLQEDLEKLSGQVLGHFRQHCNITRLEQQFMLQAQALPEREQQRFQESAKTAIVKLRRAANTGQAIEPLHARTSPVHGDARQSVRVKLHKIKAEQQEKPVLHKKRDDPQR